MSAARVASKAEVFDLDAARAARREAAVEGFKFVWQGDEYECLPAREWPIDVTASLASGDLVSALLVLLGDDGQKFVDTKPTAGDVEALMDAMAKWSGLGATGN